MQYRLRTLLILLAVGPPVLAGTWFRYLDHHERQRLAADRELELVLTQLLYDTKARTVIQFSGSLLQDLPDEVREQLRSWGLQSEVDPPAEHHCVD